MCGFAALFEQGRIFPPRLLKQFDKDLFHRGPDAGGEISEEGIALVFRRLSILDTSRAADQPMTDETGRFTLVYNGEIYNYRQLRLELEAQGVRFRTNCDTEVLLHGLIRWGIDALQRLEGMFAFVFVDRVEKYAYAARDPFGIKPLYSRQVGRTIAFSSEIRPLARLAPSEPCAEAIAELLSFGWAAGTLSNVKGIERVEPGHVLEVSLNEGTVRRHRYFDLLGTLETRREISLETATERVEHELDASLLAHLASDVGYTVQLSGGVDSSLLTALTRNYTKGPLHTFGVDLGNYEHDEKRWRQQVVDRYQVDHHEVQMDGLSFAEALPRAIHHMEGPVPHGGCVLLMRLCDQIRNFSKVVLVGEGADEVFGGYERYVTTKKAALRETLGHYLPDTLLPDIWPFKGIKRLAGRDGAAWASVYSNTSRIHKLFPALIPVPGFREQKSRRFKDFYDRLFAVDQTVYLESLLVRQDKMSMAASVESRVPFVHLPLIELANSLPHSTRIAGGTTKPLLKHIASAHLPHDLVYRRKIGLLLPYDEWCRDDAGVGRYLSLLTDSGSQLRAYTRRQDLEGAVNRFRAGDVNENRYMFQLINIELWLRSFVGATVYK